MATARTNQGQARRQQHRQSVVGAAVEAARTGGGRGMDHALATITTEQERLAEELRNLGMKLDAAIIAGQVPEEMAAAVAEAVHGQESVLRMLMLQVSRFLTYQAPSCSTDPLRILADAAGRVTTRAVVPAGRGNNS